MQVYWNVKCNYVKDRDRGERMKVAIYLLK